VAAWCEFPGLKDDDRQAEDFVRMVRELVAEECDVETN
jgi:hypothetical protein